MPNKVTKPWGWEEILDECYFYRIKRLHINAGHRTSLQYHRYKIETILFPDKTVKHIAPHEVHRLEATIDDLEVIEVSNGFDLDIVRIEDDYGRMKQ